MEDKRFKELYETYYPKLKVMFSKKIKDEQEVEDVIQDTMLRVYTKYSTYDDKYALSTWLYTVANSVLNSHFRSKSRQPALSYAKELYDNTYTESFDSPENILVAQEQANAINNSLKKLSGDFLEVYTMKDAEGMSLKSISEQLDVPINTVKSRLKRARDLVKENLQ